MQYTSNQMITTIFLIFIVAVIPFSGCCSVADNQRPNVILILADDLGFSDLGCYGGEIKTPNLDRLAENGIRCTQFYNASRCCPTRASLLTGLYPHQAGVGHMTENKGLPAYSGELSRYAPTIAEILKKSGYSTCMTGKWHLTANTKPSDPDDNRPTDRGFDHFYGTLPGHGSYWDPVGLMEDRNFIKPKGDYYYTEAISGYACKFIQQASLENTPFFLYVAYTAPHYPLHAREEMIKKYEKTYLAGWDDTRMQRYKRMKDLGLINTGWQLPERDIMSYPWEQDSVKEWQAARMAVYAAMVDHMDQGIADIIRTLEESGQLYNTVIFFLSDNGGSAEGHLFNTVERLGKPWISPVIPDSTSDGRKVKAGDWPGENPGGPDTYGSYGLSWANVSNTPFRLHKSWVHEGGISTPFIIYGPGMIKGKTGINHQPGHIIDIMPTILDMTDIEYPEKFQGRKTLPLAGISLLPSLMENRTGNRTLFWEHEGNKAIREGKWKLVMEWNGEWNRPGTQIGTWELYDMEKDRMETNNLAGIYPDLVKELKTEWELWAESCGVIPWDELTKK